MIVDGLEEEIRIKLKRAGYKYTSVKGFKDFYIKHYMQISN